MDRLQKSPFFFGTVFLMVIAIPFSTLMSKSSSATLIPPKSGTRLACLTVYWGGEGDKWTSNGLSATGVRLRKGHCAVDPRVIPYGSVISINGVGTFLAVDTGKAVASRRAAKMIGVTVEQKGALVIDLFFTSRREAEQFAGYGPKYATISWWAPSCADSRAEKARKNFKSEDWDRLRSLGMLSTVSPTPSTTNSYP